MTDVYLIRPMKFGLFRLICRLRCLDHWLVIGVMIAAV